MQMFQMLYGLARFGIDMDKQQMSCFWVHLGAREWIHEFGATNKNRW